MNSKRIQFNRRSVTSFLLAILVLVVTAIPALAWYDEGNGFQAANQRMVDQRTYRPAVASGLPEIPFSLSKVE